MDSFVAKASAPNETLRPSDIVGIRVIAKSGQEFGRVKQIRFNKKNYNFEGIVVRRPFKADAYVCITYIDRITADAVMLSVEPASLWEGKAIVSADGKKIGLVKTVRRIGDTNDIDSFVVDKGWFRSTVIEFKDVKQMGASIILTKNYEQVKRDRKP